MRKLRNLWSSHKKYCTTSVALRSYTPLSGYPHSRSSYDLDRTYYTSTPYTNRFRRPESRFGSDIGDVIRNLSDLSIDNIDDSDDDPAKVRLSDVLVLTLKDIKSMIVCVFLSEIATQLGSLHAKQCRQCNVALNVCYFMVKPMQHKLNTYNF